MLRRLRIHGLVLAALVAAGASAPVAAQTLGEKESFTAIAIANNELGSGAGRVLIDVTRWSTDAETAALVKAVQEGGSQDLLEKLRDQRSTGRFERPIRSRTICASPRKCQPATGAAASYWRLIGRCPSGRPGTSRERSTTRSP
jgi:hypothetical protein